MKEPCVTTYKEKYRVIEERRLKQSVFFLCSETTDYLIDACSFINDFTHSLSRAVCNAMRQHSLQVME